MTTLPFHQAPTHICERTHARQHNNRQSVHLPKQCQDARACPNLGRSVVPTCRRFLKAFRHSRRHAQIHTPAAKLAHGLGVLSSHASILLAQQQFRVDLPIAPSLSTAQTKWLGVHRLALHRQKLLLQTAFPQSFAAAQQPVRRASSLSLIMRRNTDTSSQCLYAAAQRHVSPEILQTDPLALDLARRQLA